MRNPVAAREVLRRVPMLSRLFFSLQKLERYGVKFKRKGKRYQHVRRLHPIDPSTSVTCFAALTEALMSYIIGYQGSIPYIGSNQPGMSRRRPEMTFVRDANPTFPSGSRWDSSSGGRKADLNNLIRERRESNEALWHHSPGAMFFR